MTAFPIAIHRRQRTYCYLCPPGTLARELSSARARTEGCKFSESRSAFGGGSRFAHLSFVHTLLKTRSQRNKLRGCSAHLTSPHLTLLTVGFQKGSPPLRSADISGRNVVCLLVVSISKNKSSLKINRARSTTLLLSTRRHSKIWQGAVE